MTVFALSWGTTALGFSRGKFLLMQLFDVSFFALFIPVSAILAERGRRKVMLWITAGIAAFGLVMAPMFVAGTTGAVLMMALGLSLMGLTYGPLGTVISELFPDAGALYGQLAGVQPGGDSGRVARALHRDVAGDDRGASSGWATISRDRRC